MKILHTSDWHLAHSFAGYDRTDEFGHFFGQLALIAAEQKPDAIVVCGDIFHIPSPPIAAQRQLTEALLALHHASPRSEIIVTSGNHDSGTRLETTKALWQTQRVHIIGSFSQAPEDDSPAASHFVVEIPGRGWVVAVPFFPPSYFPRIAEVGDMTRIQAFFKALQEYVEDINAESLPVVMTAHLALDGCNLRGHEAGSVAGMETEHVDSLGGGYDYLALGHIHMPQTLSPRVRYCGTPLPVSFSEEYAHSITMVEIDCHGANPKISTIPIDQLRPVHTLRADSTDHALELLSKIDDAKECYIKVVIAPSEIVTPLTLSTLLAAAEGKNCRICDVVNAPKEASSANEGTAEAPPTMEAVRARSPLDLADEYFRKKTGADMDSELRSMLQNLISDVTFNDSSL